MAPTSPDPPSPSFDSPDEDPTRIANRDFAVSPDAPTQAGDAHSAPSDYALPAAIGNYRIVRKLGEGGMGIVFEAEQEHPRRRVALKMIRGTFVDEERVRMFRREVATLARLEHPNIGAIYDAGRTDAGEHFFAMELVRGRTLDAYLGARPPTLDAGELRFRLRLFHSICSAVSYAHQRGVIHRDLKPSNIVVAQSGDGSTPGAPGGSPTTATSSANALPLIKVLDFGLARMTDTDVNAATAMTEMGVLKGTLPYMSPEQARGDPGAIDVRSDVYALGVILYEMLTGARPYDTQRASILEAVRIICDEPPASLLKSWPGSRRPDADLQTIIGKALEKEASRRYESAAALADDVERYLDARPIHARAPSSAYQLRKFAQRNRTLVTGVVAVLVTLTAGIVAATTFGLREAAQRRVAEQARVETQAVAEFQADMLGDINPDRMGHRMAEDLAHRLGEYLHERGGVPPHRIDAERDAFRAQLERVSMTDAALLAIDENVLRAAGTAANQRFRNQPKVRAQLLESIGNTYLRLGMYDAAEPPLVSAKAIHDSLEGPGSVASLKSAHALGTLYMFQGQVQPAESLLVAASDGLRRTLGLQQADVLSAIGDLGLLYTDLERHAEADSLLGVALRGQLQLKGETDRSTLTIMANLASSFQRQEKYPQAESLGVRVLALRRRVLGAEHAETMQSVNDLAITYRRMGRLEDAEKLYLEDYETSRRTLGEHHPELLVTMTNLGRLYVARGKYKEAVAILSTSLTRTREMMPPGFVGTAITGLALSQALVGMGRYHEAERAAREAYDIYMNLGGERAKEGSRAAEVLADICSRTGRTDEAAAWKARVGPRN